MLRWHRLVKTTASRRGGCHDPGVYGERSSGFPDRAGPSYLIDDSWRGVVIRGDLPGLRRRCIGSRTCDAKTHRHGLMTTGDKDSTATANYPWTRRTLPMTLPAPTGGEPAAAPDPSDDPTLNALRPLIFGDEYTLHVTVRDAVMALGDVPESGIAYPRLVRRLVGALGGSAEVISADPWLRGALCEWVAVAAPRLLPMVSAEFHTSSGTALQDVRMDLANASMASARAAVAMLVDHGPWVDAVRHDVVSAMAAIYVATAVGVEARDRVGAGIDGDPAGALWAMLAKAQLSETCRSVLAVCRLHTSQTVLVDHLPDWECLAEGICGAAGRNLDLAVAAGGLPRHVAVASALEGLDITALTAWEAPAALPWWHAMLREREQAFAAAVRESRVDVFGGELESAGGGVLGGSGPADQRSAGARPRRRPRCFLGPGEGQGARALARCVRAGAR
jgi:hypothetical protein